MLKLWIIPLFKSGILGLHMTTTLTANGQVTIPKWVCQQLGIGPGSEVDFQLAEDTRVVLVRVVDKLPAGRCAKLRGHAGRGLDTDAIMALTRGET